MKLECPGLCDYLSHEGDFFEDRGNFQASGHGSGEDNRFTFNVDFESIIPCFFEGTTESFDELGDNFLERVDVIVKEEDL